MTTSPQPHVFFKARMDMMCSDNNKNFDFENKHPETGAVEAAMTSRQRHLASWPLDKTPFAAYIDTVK